MNDPSDMRPSAVRPPRSWRGCIRRALADLHGSIRRGRRLSLPNVLRAFDRRWHLASANRPERIRRRGRHLGLSFIRAYYRGRLP